MPTVGVVIVSFNTCELLRACLASLRVCRLPLRVVVVDSASHDGSAAMVRASFAEVELIALDRNIGFAAGNNIGLAHLLECSPNYILLLNPDTVVHAGAIEALAAFLDRHPRVGMVGPRLLNADGTLQPAAFRFPTLAMSLLDLFPPGEALPGRLYGSWWHGRYPQERDDAPFPIDHPLGACMLVRRAVVEQVGALDEAFFMYAEEVDWCYRIRRAGWAIWQVPAARVTHVGGAATRQFRQRMLIALYESRLRFFRKHYDARFIRWHTRIVRVGMLRAALLAWRDYARGTLAGDELRARLWAYGKVFQLDGLRDRASAGKFGGLQALQEQLLPAGLLGYAEQPGGKVSIVGRLRLPKPLHHVRAKAKEEGRMEEMVLRPSSFVVRRTALSVAIIARDEERHIGGALASVAGLAAEVVVLLDSRTRDRTGAICRAHGARLVVEPWRGYPAQRNRALELCGCDWVLLLDADERVTAELAAEIRQVTGDRLQVTEGVEGTINAITCHELPATCAGYWIPRYNRFFGQVVRGGGWYPDHQLRLLRRGHARYDAARQVHEVAQLDGAAGYLSGHLLHLNIERLGELWRKQAGYALHEAQTLYASGVRARWRNFVGAPMREFHRRYVALGGYRDGALGLLLCATLAYFEWVKFVHLKGLERAR